MLSLLEGPGRPGPVILWAGFNEFSAIVQYRGLLFRAPWLPRHPDP